MRISVADREWELTRWSDTVDPHPTLHPSDPSVVYSVLLELAFDAYSMNRLRQYILEWNPNGFAPEATDIEVLEHVNWLVNCGRLRLFHVSDRTPLSVTHEKLSGAVNDEPSFPLPARNNRSSSPPPPPEPATFPQDADAAAIASAMKDAASLGVPFCEECTRARLAAARGAN